MTPQDSMKKKKFNAKLWKLRRALAGRFLESFYPRYESRHELLETIAEILQEGFIENDLERRLMKVLDDLDFGSSGVVIQLDDGAIEKLDQKLRVALENAVYVYRKELHEEAS